MFSSTALTVVLGTVHGLLVDRNRLVGHHWRRVRKRQQNDGRVNDALGDIPPRDKFRIHSFNPVLDALYSKTG